MVPKRRNEKAEIVEELKEKFSKIEGAALADYRGLNVDQINGLRDKLRENGLEFKVVKNNLAKIAADEVEIEGLEEYLIGPVGIALGYDDPVAPAKFIKEYAKKNNKLELKAGILEKKAINEEKVKQLADLPGKEELLGKVVGLLQAPIRNFVVAAQGNINNFVYVLEALRQKREEQGES